MTLPLERFRMLDLTRLVPGPMATWMLADLGMDVLKIEDVADRSAYRDQQEARRSRENFTADQEAREKEVRANAWDHTHRNKRSIAINLQKPEGQAIFHRLVKDADVFFGSFRLGVYKRLGADYERLSKINPRLIYATISGYGFGNSFTEWPGNERNAQGMSGVSALMTGQDGEPADMLCQPVDSYSAALAVIAIQSALLAREQTGRGQPIARTVGGAGQIFVEAVTRLAHPTDLPARIADDERKVGDVADDNRSGAYEAILTQRVPTNNCRVGANGRPAVHQGRKELMLALDLGARVDDVCEHARGTAKNSVRQCHARVDADIVLDLASVSNRNARSNHDILANDAALANLDVTQDMAEMPNAGAITDGDGFVDIGAFVNQHIRKTRMHVVMPVHRRKHPYPRDS
jgi:hypothetical protein